MMPDNNKRYIVHAIERRDVYYEVYADSKEGAIEELNSNDSWLFKETLNEFRDLKAIDAELEYIPPSN